VVYFGVLAPASCPLKSSDKIDQIVITSRVLSELFYNFTKGRLYSHLSISKYTTGQGCARDPKIPDRDLGLGDRDVRLSVRDETETKTLSQD